MKVEIKPRQWKEITTKIINVYGNWNFSQFDFTIQEWIDSNKRLGLYKNRKICQCCHTSREKFFNRDKKKVVFIKTDKGNKIICPDCAAELGI